MLKILHECQCTSRCGPTTENNRKYMRAKASLFYTALLHHSLSFLTTPTTEELRHLPTEATATLPWAPTGSSLFFSLYLCNEMQYPYQLTSVQFSSVAQSCPTLCPTPWTAARQASLSITSSQSLLKLMPIESVMPSKYLILCRCPLWDSSARLYLTGD